LELQAQFPLAEAFLGLSEAALGDADHSIPLLEKSFASTQPSIDQELKRLVGIRLGKLYSTVGRSMDAESIYLSLLKEYPDDQEVLYENFWLRMTGAREIMKTLLRTAPNSYRTHQMLAYLLAEKGDYAAAAEQFRAALKINPSAIGVHCELGNMLLSLSPDDKAARAEYAEELRLHPSHAPSYYQLAQLALRDRELDKAWTLYNQALEFEPSHANALVGLAKICMSREQPLQALSYGEKAVKADPQNQSAHYLLSQIYLKLGRTREGAAESRLFEKLQSEGSKESQYLAGAQIGSPTELLRNETSEEKRK
jgi:Tfp pilus assembly protein PilF